MSQIEAIRAHLLKGKSITPIEALNKHGCFRLAAIIFNIRAEGFTVETEIVHRNGKKWASYTLIGHGKTKFS